MTSPTPPGTATTEQRVLAVHPDDVDLPLVKHLAAGAGVDVVANRNVKRGEAYLMRLPVGPWVEQGKASDE